MSQKNSLQERLAPKSLCYGCGPSNENGLRIRSFDRDDGENGLVCLWTPKSHHEAFPGVINGGVLGSILDCHLNWTAAVALMRASGVDTLPSTVTAHYTVRMEAPTPSGKLLRILSKVDSIEKSRIITSGEIQFEDSEGVWTATATGNGLFVAVKPGHPAYHRW